MLLLRTFSLWLLVVLLQRGSQTSTGAQRSGRGRFSTGDNMRCTWSSRDARDSVTLRVKCENSEARIKGGITDFSCVYRGRPEICGGFRSDQKGFWRQVARALRKLRGRLCWDESALLRAGMCKRAPKDAHFRLDASSSVLSAQSGEPETTTGPPLVLGRASASPTACARRADHRRTAEEFCSRSWASWCSFLLTMLQSDDC